MYKASPKKYIYIRIYECTATTPKTEAEKCIRLYRRERARETEQLSHIKTMLSLLYHDAQCR